MGGKLTGMWETDFRELMNLMVIAAGVVFFVGVMGGAAWRLKRRERAARGGPGSGWAHYAKPRRRLMSASEQAFERQIRRVLKARKLGGWRIYGQVAMLALFEPVAARGGWTLPPWILDFVLVDGEGDIRGVVELNDPTHRRRDRQIRDDKLERGFKALGVPLLFVTASGTEELDRWIGKVAR